MTARPTYFSSAIGEAIQNGGAGLYVGRTAIVFTPSANTSYLLFWSALIGNTSVVTNDANIQVRDGAGTVIAQGNIESQDTTDRAPLSGCAVLTYGSSPTQQVVPLFFGPEAVSNNIPITDASMVAMQMTANVDVSAANTSNQVNTTTTMANAVTLNWTPASNGSYLLVGSWESNFDAAGECITQILHSGTAYGTNTPRLRDTTNYIPGMHAVVLSNLSGAQTAVVQWARSATIAGNARCRNARLVAIRLDAFDNVYQASSRARQTMNTNVFANAVTTGNVSITNNSHLVIGVGVRDINSTTISARTRLARAGNAISSFGNAVQEGTVASTTIDVPAGYGQIFIDKPGAITTSWQVQYASESNGTSTGISEAAIIALDLGLTATQSGNQRYWVSAANASWSALANVPWAFVSGGNGGNWPPTAEDSVFFDANSGSNVATITALASVKGVSTTGFNGTFAGSSSLTVGSGGFFLNPTMGYTYTGSLTFANTAGNAPLSFSGRTVGTGLILTANASPPNGIVLTSDLTTQGTLTVDAGNFDFGGFNVSLGAFAANTNNGPTNLKLPTTVFLTANSGTVVNTGGANKVYNDLANTTLWLTGTGNRTVFWTNGSNTPHIHVGAGAGNISFSGSSTTTGAQSLTFNSGFTGNIVAGSGIFIGVLGNVTFSPSMLALNTANTPTISLLGANTSGTLTTHNIMWPGALTINALSGEKRLGSALTLANTNATYGITVAGGTFNTAGFSVTTSGLTFDGTSVVRGMILDNSIIYITRRQDFGGIGGSISAFHGANNRTVTATGSTVFVQGSSNLAGAGNNAGGAQVLAAPFPDIRLVDPSTGGWKLVGGAGFGSNIATLTIAGPGILMSDNNSPQRLGNVTVTGLSSGNVLTMNISGSGTLPSIWAKEGSGIIGLDWLNITGINASPAGNTFYAGGNSVNGGNTTGWVFTDAPVSDDAEGTDNIILSDSSTRGKVTLVSTIEPLLLNDIGTAIKAAFKAAVENVVLAESSARSKAAASQGTENVVLGDRGIAAKAAAAIGRENVVLSDTNTRSKTTTKTGSDNVVLGDTSAKSKTAPAALTENIVLSERALAAVTTRAAGTDNIVLGDRGAFEGGSEVSRDNVVLGEQSAVAKVRNATAADNVILNSQQAAAKTAAGDRAENIVLADRGVAQLTGTARGADNVALDATAAAQATLNAQDRENIVLGAEGQGAKTTAAMRAENIVLGEQSDASTGTVQSAAGSDGLGLGDMSDCFITRETTGSLDGVGGWPVVEDRRPRIRGGVYATLPQVVTAKLRASTSLPFIKHDGEVHGIAKATQLQKIDGVLVASTEHAIVKAVGQGTLRSTLRGYSPASLDDPDLRDFMRILEEV